MTCSLGRRTALWFGFVLTLAAIGCSQSPPLGPRHTESGLNSSFRYSDMTYPEYVAHMKHVIEETRTDLTPERKDTIVAWNSPFIRMPDPAHCPAKEGRYRDGILLIHGLTDSPFHMWDLAAHFQQKCFVVFGLLLPGHGTVPGDLLSVTYQDWIKAAQFGVAQLKPQVERVFIGGFSTGGSLAVYEALTDDQIAGIFLFAPALELKQSGAAFAGTIDAFSGKQGQWIDVYPDEDPAKYESFPYNAGYQIWQLTHELHRMGLHAQVTMPIFAALSDDDTTVNSSATIDFFKAQPDKRSRLIVYSRSSQDWGDPRIVTEPSRYPAEQVLNMGHLSLTNAPENPHYGIKGDYRNCLHYGDDPKRWAVCKHGAVPWGEIDDDILKEHVIRRLTYNPDFVHLTWEIDQFLDRMK